MPRQALIVDGDNTLWQGRTAEGIGKALFTQEAKRLHLRKLLRGLRGRKEIEEILRTVGGVEGDIRGLERFYQLLLENEVGDLEHMYRYAGRYIRAHLIDSVSALVRTELLSGRPVFLTTASGDATARYVERDLYTIPLADSCHNEEVYDNRGRLVGFRLPIFDGETKLHTTEEMAGRHGLRLSDCTVVGNDALDVPLLRAAGEAFYSPYATDEVKAIKGIKEIRR